MFHRVIAPAADGQVLITDKDLRVTMRFMISIVTIFEEMQQDQIDNPKVKLDYKIYARKIKKYGPTFDGIMD